MELGVAGTIGLEFFTDTIKANSWLEENADKEILDIKFSSAESAIDILVIYRKDD